MSLLVLVSLGFVDPSAIAQEVVAQAPSCGAMDPTALAVDQEKALAPKPGSDFKECANGCPVMIVIPAGKFMMGSPENEPDRNASEGPPHEVTIAKPFGVSRFEVTGVLRHELFVVAERINPTDRCSSPAIGQTACATTAAWSPAEPRPVGMTVAGAAGAYLRAGDSEAEDSALR